MENRYSNRLSAHLPVTLNLGITVVDGMVRDVSLHGMYIETNARLPSNQLIWVYLLSSAHATKPVGVRAMVVHCEADGVGVEVYDNALDGFLAEARVQAVHALAHDAVDSEYASKVERASRRCGRG